MVAVIDQTWATIAAKPTIRNLANSSVLVVGGLFGWAAARFDASKATGLDGAVHTIVEAPFGRVLLTVVALGIGAFGLFSLLRARYPSRT